MELDIKINGADEFEKALKEIQQKFPESTKRKLDEKAKELESYIGEDMESQGIVRTGRLKKSFEHYPPEKKGSIYEVRVTSKEKYAHLIEEGHELVLYSPKKKDGGKAHHLGRVKGYHMVENAMDELNENYIQDIESWMYNLIKNGVDE